MNKCPLCGTPLVFPHRGRPQIYCSAACRRKRETQRRRMGRTRVRQGPRAAASPYPLVRQLFALIGDKEWQAVALRAGYSESILSRWASGVRPKLPAFVDVLGALDAELRIVVKDGGSDSEIR